MGSAALHHLQRQLAVVVLLANAALQKATAVVVCFSAANPINASLSMEIVSI
jgi:hypothetical protein